MRKLFYFYGKFIPKYAGLFLNKKLAYDYLIESIKQFPNQVELSNKLKKYKFNNVTVIDILDGLAAIHISKNELSSKKILLVVTGGIASYKSLDLIRRLQENDVSIECILTKNAEKFVNVLSFESLLEKNSLKLIPT